MWIVEMDGEFQALFAMEADAFAFRAARQSLFPDRAVAVAYIYADSALIEKLTAK